MIYTLVCDAVDVSLPKRTNNTSRTAPRLLKLQLQRGNEIVNGFEATDLGPAFENLGVGSKLRLQTPGQSCGLLRLEPTNCQIVERIEKYKEDHSRKEGDAPTFQPFVPPTDDEQSLKPSQCTQIAQPSTSPPGAITAKRARVIHLTFETQGLLSFNVQGLDDGVNHTLIATPELTALLVPSSTGELLNKLRNLFVGKVFTFSMRRILVDDSACRGYSGTSTAYEIIDIT